MDGNCLFTPGVADQLYASIRDPDDKKTLSIVSKAARKSFVDLYFAGGLIPGVMRVRPHVGSSSSTRCSNLGCGKTSTASIMGLSGARTLGLSFHCNSAKCREAVVRASYAKVARALQIDGGRGHYVSHEDFPSYFDRAIELARLSKVNHHAAPSPYYKLRTLHDCAVSSMLKRALSGGSSSNTSQQAWCLNLNQSDMLAAMECDQKGLSDPNDKTVSNLLKIQDAIYVDFSSWWGVATSDSTTDPMAT